MQGLARSQPSAKWLAMCLWLPNLAPERVGSQLSPEGEDGKHRLLLEVTLLLELGRRHWPGSWMGAQATVP